MSITQGLYIQGLIKEFRLQDAKPAITPVSDRATLLKGSTEEALADQALYQRAIGSLLWVARGSRGDIQYAVSQLSQHCNAPTVHHWNAVLRVFKYLKGTANFKIQYKSGDPALLGLLGYCDADYGGDIEDRRSVSRHLFLLGRGPITWNSTKQRCVSMSTTEAEYIALSEACKQGQWIRALLKELQCTQFIQQSLATPILSDNQGYIALARDPIAHSRTKHIDIRYHYIRDLISFGKTSVDYIRTEDMKADMLTKPLPLATYNRCIEGLFTL